MFQCRPPQSRRAVEISNVLFSSAGPRGAHGVQRGFLEIVANLFRVALEVPGNHIADLPKAGGGRDADVLAEVVKALEDPEAHAGFEGLRSAGLLQRLMAAGGNGPGFIVDLIGCGHRNRSADNYRKGAGGPASSHQILFVASAKG